MPVSNPRQSYEDLMVNYPDALETLLNVLIFALVTGHVQNCAPPRVMLGIFGASSNPRED